MSNIKTTIGGLCILAALVCLWFGKLSQSGFVQILGASASVGLIAAKDGDR